jgi:phage baseplate assembly protein gpV
MDALVELFRRFADLERRVNNGSRHGTVAEVDASKGRMRLKVGDGDGGEPFLSPWVPYAQTAGALKVHAPPSVGQQMTLLSPTGDMRQGIAIPMTWSDTNQAPSDKGDENVITFGPFRIELTSGKLKVTGPEIEFITGGHSQKWNGSGSTLAGGRVEHDGKNIGSDHIHGGVLTGGAKTDVPEP